MSPYAESLALGASRAGAARAAFIRRTYLHLAFAIAGFVSLEYVLLQSAFAEGMLRWVLAGPYNWLMVLGGFIVVGWMARGFAGAIENPALQYAGLGLFITAEAVIFLPMIMIAGRIAPDAIPMAGIMTGLLFGGLTGTVFITRHDFSFLRGILMVGGFVALGLIVCGVAFGFNLGLLFSGGMVLLAAGGILYDTSNVLHHYRTDQHVAASLELFASLALLFWYVLRILMIIGASRD